MTEYLKYIFYSLLILFPILCSCKSQTEDNGDSTADTITLKYNEAKIPVSDKKFEIFGVTTSYDDAEILLKLQERRILKIDTLSLDEERNFKFAIVEFASVKFGVNPGLIFLTSRCDKEAINSLVSKISSYYGEPEVSPENDDYDDEPQYYYYNWNNFESDKPHIQIRPLHTEEGGLKMMWKDFILSFK